MLIVAQSMALTCAGCGLLMFIYIHFFSYRRLRYQGRHMECDEARNNRQMEVASDPGQQIALVGMAPAQADAALFYLYQEQVRRFIDAKIDILRNAAETQNRILVIQAETVRNASLQSGSPMIEIDTKCDAMLPAVHREVSSLFNQFHEVRGNVERNLADIDEQIRSLPGPSLSQWASSQGEDY